MIKYYHICQIFKIKTCKNYTFQIFVIQFYFFYNYKIKQIFHDFDFINMNMTKKLKFYPLKIYLIYS